MSALPRLTRRSPSLKKLALWEPDAPPFEPSRANYLGGQGLLYPLRSSTFRETLAGAKAGFGAGALIGIVMAEAQAVIVEGYKSATGRCH